MTVLDKSWLRKSLSRYHMVFLGGVFLWKYCGNSCYNVDNSCPRQELNLRPIPAKGMLCSSELRGQLNKTAVLGGRESPDPTKLRVLSPSGGQRVERMTRSKKRYIGLGIVDKIGGFSFKIGDWDEEAYCLLDNVPIGKYKIILERVKKKNGGD